MFLFVESVFYLMAEANFRVPFHYATKAPAAFTMPFHFATMASATIMAEFLEDVMDYGL